MVSVFWANKIMADAYTNGSGEFWFGLSSTCPHLDGSGVSEPAGGGYVRVQITGFSTPENGMVRNLNALQFPQSSDTWFPSENKARYWVLFDGANAGANVLAAGELHIPLTVDVFTNLNVDAGELQVVLTDVTLG